MILQQPFNSSPPSGISICAHNYGARFENYEPKIPIVSNSIIILTDKLILLMCKTLYLIVIDHF